MILRSTKKYKYHCWKFIRKNCVFLGWDGVVRRKGLICMLCYSDKKVVILEYMCIKTALRQDKSKDSKKKEVKLHLLIDKIICMKRIISEMKNIYKL